MIVEEGIFSVIVAFNVLTLLMMAGFFTALLLGMYALKDKHGFASLMRDRRKAALAVLSLFSFLFFMSIMVFPFLSGIYELFDQIRRFFFGN